MKPNYELKPAMEKLGIKQLRTHQIKPIQSLKDGEDTIVIAGTSSGKSKIYEIPGLLHKKKLTLVLEPTLSLIYNQVQDLQDHGVKADYLDHFRTKKDVQKIYEKIRQKELTFLYVTPERLQSKEFLEVMEDAWIDILVIDEKNLEKRLKKRFKQVEKYINKYHDEGSVVIYALTTGYVDALYNYLNDLYPDQVVRYHSQIQPESLRHQMELDFLQGKRKIMVATSAFGMGIDVPDIELVLHFNTPLSMTDYIQQIGRGGRDQKTRCTCVLFYEENGDDAKIVHSFVKRAEDESKKAASMIRENYEQMKGFIHSSNCMLQDILAYQGQIEEKTCKCCTCCARKRRGD